MRRKNTPQEDKKRQERTKRKSKVRKQRAATFQQSTPDEMAAMRTVSAHALEVLHRRRFPVPGE